MTLLNRIILAAINGYLCGLWGVKKNPYKPNSVGYAAWKGGRKYGLEKAREKVK